MRLTRQSPMLAGGAAGAPGAGDVSRRNFLRSGAGLALAPAGKPNIVILLSDDQRWSTIGAWGLEPVQTPNLDRLARRGVSFDHAHIMGGDQGAVCVPSRAMFHTGQTLWRASANVQARASDTEAPRRYTLLGEHFRAHGYLAHGIGKWHNPPRLFNRAFSSGGAIFFGGMTDQFNAPVQEYDESGEYSKSRQHSAGKHTSEAFADAAVSFLKQRDGAKPFLLYTAFTSPHDPRTAPAPFSSMYSPDKVPLPRNFLPEHPFDNGEMKVRDELLASFPRRPEEIRKHIADYYGMISHLDAQIGRILDTIDASPWASNTIVVFAGDNGLALGQHGLMGKQNVYDHSVRVPLIVAGPGLAAGQRRTGLCYLLDVYPTLCELAGLPVPPSVEGKSLVKGKGREEVYYAYRNFQRGIRHNDWKLISYNVSGQRTVQLFDMKNDPWETVNLADKPRQSGQLDSLNRRLRQQMESTGDPATAAGFVTGA